LNGINLSTSDHHFDHRTAAAMLTGQPLIRLESHIPTGAEVIPVRPF
jgi:hypothetical protein